MQLWFVRHAQPGWTAGGKSHHDPGLTESGRRQAALLADRLAVEDEPFTALVASPARRAVETAEPLAKAIGLEPQIVPDLTEIRMPDWRGTAPEQVSQIFADSLHRPPEAWWEGLPGGESFRAFHERVSVTLADLLDAMGMRRAGRDPTELWHLATSGEKVLVVAHGGTNAVALGFLLGVEPTPWEWERFVLGHSAIATLVARPLGGGHILSMRSFNDREHLPHELRTR